MENRVFISKKNTIKSSQKSKMFGCKFMSISLVVNERLMKEDNEKNLIQHYKKFSVKINFFYLDKTRYKKFNEKLLCISLFDL